MSHETALARALARVPCDAEAASGNPEASWNGETIVIRPIAGADERPFLEFVRRLEPEDLRMRFFGCPHQLTHEELVRLTQVDQARELALVALRKKDGCDEILGVARAVTEPCGGDAELGIIVRSDLKQAGLGGLLLRRLIAHLVGRGPRRLVAYVLHENAAMRELARSMGFVTDGAGCDGQVLCLVLDLVAHSRSEASRLGTRGSAAPRCTDLDGAQSRPPPHG